MSEGKLKNCHTENIISRDCHVRTSSFLAMTMILFPFSAHATCTPTPDCASIGYTQTSCETKSVKCPFDTSKLFCLPCDTKFQYTCSGDNITGGTGSSCNNKYVSCSCSNSEYTFSNGECKCNDFTPSDCIIGAIYYPNGECSNDYISCQNPVGVVVKDNELVMSWKSRTTITWGGYGTDIADLPNFSSAEADYAGVKNTSIIVASHTSLGETASSSAAIYCNEYAPKGMENTKGEWYLPAVSELYDYLYGNYSLIQNIYTTYLNSNIHGGWFWPSSEHSQDYMWYVNASSDSIGITSKNNKLGVVCLYSII